MNSTSPRQLRDRGALAARLSAVHTEPRVQPLNAWVSDLRQRLGDGAAVPWFDPASGGQEARILFLLEAPGQKSVGKEASLRKTGSGIISVDNDDQTAENCWRAREEAGLSYREVVHWNIVPWYLGSATKIAAPGRSEIEQALPYLHEVIGLLPRLEIVVATGKKAQDGWDRYSRKYHHELMMIPTVHPSPRVFNTTPTARSAFLHALQSAKGSLLPLPY